MKKYLKQLHPREFERRERRRWTQLAMQLNVDPAGVRADGLSGAKGPYHFSVMRVFESGRGDTSSTYFLDYHVEFPELGPERTFRKNAIWRSHGVSLNDPSFEAVVSTSGPNPPAIAAYLTPLRRSALQNLMSQESATVTTSSISLRNQTLFTPGADFLAQKIEMLLQIAAVLSTPTDIDRLQSKGQNNPAPLAPPAPSWVRSEP